MPPTINRPGLQEILRNDYKEALESWLKLRTPEQLEEMFGESPLRKAVEALSPGCTKVLLDLQSGVDAPGHCPLLCEALYEAQLAIGTGRAEDDQRRALEIMTLLLDKGADPNEVDHAEFPPLFYALALPAQFAELLLSRGARHTDPVPCVPSLPLALAVALRKPESVKVLLQHGADPSASLSDSPAPLLVAAERGNVELIRVLLQGGANPDVADKRGRGVLDLLLVSSPGSLNTGRDRQLEVSDLLAHYQQVRALEAAVPAGTPTPKARM